MTPLSRTLLTTLLCVVIGVIAGRHHRPTEPESALAPVVASTKASSKVATLALKPPPFISIEASLEWVRQQTASGHLDAAEGLFRSDAGLTNQQRIKLAWWLVTEFHRMEPRVLARIVLGLPRGEAADELLSNLVSRWAECDAADALLFLEALPSDRLNSRLLNQAAFGLRHLPAERLLAFAQLLDDNGRAFLAAGLTANADTTGSWQNTSSVLAAMHYKHHDDAVPADWHMGNMLGRDSPEQVEQLIQAETDTQKRDQLLLGYIDALGSTHFQPDQHLAWAAQITDPQVQQTAFSVQIIRWLQYDRNAALDWLRGNEAAQLLRPSLREGFLGHYQPPTAQ